MKKLSLAIFLFLSFISYSQVTYEERLEFNLRESYRDAEVFVFGDKGFILYSSSDDKQDSDNIYRYEFFDNSLNFIKSDSILVSRKLKNEESYITTDKLHTIFKNRKGEFVIVSVCIDKMEITKAEGKLPSNIIINDMAVLGDIAYFKSVIRRNPYLFTINWKTGKQNPVPLTIKSVKSRDTKLVSFQIMEDLNEIFLYMYVKKSRKNFDTKVLRLDENGNKIGIINLTKDIEEALGEVTSSNMGAGKFIFTGTYSNKNIHYSQGIFFCEVNNGELQNISFINYTDLQNFLTYLPQRQQDRVEKKKNKKNKKGEDLNLNYRIVTHELITQDDGYILLGEAFFETHRTEITYITTTVNGQTTMRPTPTTVFDGYQYTHAILVKFDFNGNKLWDQTFEMWSDYKPYQVKKFISLAVADNKLKMVFANKSTIVSKVVDDQGKVIQDIASETIDTGYADDKIKNSFTNITYWYNDYFIAYGFLRIKNKEEESVKKKRNVFFVSKVKFE